MSRRQNSRNKVLREQYSVDAALGAPFGIQMPYSLRDPDRAILSVAQLQKFVTMDDVRNIALEYVHDPKAFLIVWNSTDVGRERRRLLRKLVQIQTINAVCNGFYRLSDGRKITLDVAKLRHAAVNTVQYSNNFSSDEARLTRSFSRPVQIFVVNADCLDVAIRIKKNFPSYNPLVLNMANAHCPGGGWRDGCGAQEENLHRRTNLFQCLEDPYRSLEGTRKWNYIVPEFGGIYSPCVSVFRGSEQDGYPFIPDGPEYLDFLACAAYFRPQVSRNQYGQVELCNPTEFLNTTKKINAIFKIALSTGHDTLVLSAFGCGAFGNPPLQIADLFRTIINERYLRSFKYIYFAIIDDHNSMQSHNQEGNIRPFSQVFNVPILSLNDI